MDVEVVTKRMATMGAELDLLLAEPLDALTTAERLSAAREWEALMRRQAAMGHRLVAGLADAPAAELGDTNAADALATSLRISSHTTPARRPKPSSQSWLAGSSPKSCVKQLTGWRYCSIKTASSLTPTAPDGAF